MWYKASFRDDELLWNWRWSPNVVNVSNSTEVFALQWLIVCYGNFTLVGEWRKKREGRKREGEKEKGRKERRKEKEKDREKRGREDQSECDER